MPLWSDGKTNEEIQKLSEVDGNSVSYNLHEDLLCVKEDLAKANERVNELEFSLGRLRAEILHACVEGSSSSGGIKKSAAHNLHNQALMIPPYAEQLRKDQDSE